MKCKDCGGTGKITNLDDDETLESPCPHCKGIGVKPANAEGPVPGSGGGTGQ